MLLGSQYQIEFRLYVCTCVMWALRADIWQHSWCAIASWTIQTNNNIIRVTNITCIFVIILFQSLILSLFQWNHWNCGGSIFMYSWLALINEFTSSTKNNHESLNFPTETENRCIHKIISPRISKFNSQPMKISPHEIKWFYSIFTRCDIFWWMVYSLFRLSFLKLFSHINHLCI